jgi:hypothetical protein
MNPEKMPAPHASPERTPVDYGRSVEYGSPPLSLEQVGEKPREQEQAIQSAEREPGPAAPPPILPMPAPQSQVVPMPVVATQTDNTNPVVAADDDLIEREWVDKAKKIIAETRDDPYKREREVSKLQADYLRKRYGREIGVST